MQPPAAAGGDAQYGLFVDSASPAVAEALSHTDLDWLCIDGQHSALSYDQLDRMLAVTAAGRCKRIVRVGGPTDRFHIQQALE